MTVTVHVGDCREVLQTLPADSVHCVVTSPPYWGLRDYGVDGQLGLEATPEEYVANMVGVFREVRRVLRPDGVCFLNLGDSYAAGKQGRDDEGPADLARRASAYGTGVPKAIAKGANGKSRKAPPGLKPKDLVGIPWRVAFALQADGWWLRSEMIWAKPNPMPESVTDRPTKAHEQVFLLTKSARYFWDAEAVKENAVSASRNIRSVLTIASSPFSGSHFATMPPVLAEICIKAGCPKGGTVLDPFSGAGTTAMVADRLQRNAIGVELNSDYATMSRSRIGGDRGSLLDAML